jgi:uncharacterized phage protein gp47/JayE
MALKFDPATGLSVDETAAVRDAMRAGWIAAFAAEDAPPLNVAPESPQGQLIDSEAVLVSAKDSEILFVANQFNPDAAEGIWQDALGKIYFMSRKIDEPTVVECECAGLYGTVIPAGSLVRSDDGQTLVSMSSAAIEASGMANLSFRTQGTGPIPIGAGSVNTIVTTIPGWDTVSNAASGSPGRDVESRAEFEERRRKSVAMNARGSVMAIYSAIANIAGVLDCEVLENITGDPIVKSGVAIDGHSVYISVYGGSDADIAAAIYLKKDGGCGTTGNTQVTHTAADDFGAVYAYNIERPAPTPFAIRVSIVLADGTPATIIDDIKSALLSDFYGTNQQTRNGRVRMASRVYASRFYPAVIQTAGVVSLLSAQVSIAGGDFANYVDIDADIEPVLAAGDIAVITS